MSNFGKSNFRNITAWRGIPMPPVEAHEWVSYAGEPALMRIGGNDPVGWITSPEGHTHGDGWLVHKDNRLRTVMPTAEEALAVLAMWAMLGVTG